MLCSSIIIGSFSSVNVMTCCHDTTPDP